jgi:prepilin-type N-terminal cleavage/methylation domain-containing protein
MKLRYSTSGFTLIELIIGMTIFSIGLTGIYALLHSTMSSVSYSRDEIIVSGLLREQIDLVMNIRDTNLRNYIPWDSVHIDGSSQSIFASGIYLIENDFSTTKTVIDPRNGIITKDPIKIKKIDTLSNIDEEKWNKTQLRTDSY